MCLTRPHPHAISVQADRRIDISQEVLTGSSQTRALTPLAMARYASVMPP